MVREEVLTKSRELVNQIYEKMNVIESCDTLAKKVKDLDVCFNDTDNKVIALNEVLNQVQLTGIRESIISKIYDNAAEAQSFLERLDRLNRKPAIIDPEFELAVEGMEAQPKPIIEVVPVIPALKSSKPKMTVEEVSRMYKDEGKTVTEIALHFGVTKSMASNFITRNHLTRTSSKKDKGFRDAAVEQRRKERP